MELGSPIVLVSAYGRGHWLASVLAQDGIKTTVIDVTPKLGMWPIEDVEGPFGFFRNERTTESQLDCLYSEGAFEEVANGFSLWLPQGPIEMKGPLTKFRMEHSGLNQHIKDILFSSGVSDKATKKVYANMDEMPFEQTWLLHFAHQWSGTTYCPSARAASLGVNLPLFSSFFVRRALRTALERSFEWLQSKGVEVLQPQQLVDAAFSGRKFISGFEITGAKQGLYSFDQVVWTLTSEETYYLNERLGKYFFPEGPLESQWCWIRYRIGMQECFERDSLPLHSVILNDACSPWTHENMLVLQRTSVPDQFDAWIRIPTVQRFNKEYLKHRGLYLLKDLAQRMPLSEPQILTFPQEYYYTYAQLGAPRYPVYGENHEARRNRSSFKNLHINSPEVWPHYSWGAIFERSEKIQAELIHWWKEKQLKEQKEKRKELNP